MTRSSSSRLGTLIAALCTSSALWATTPVTAPPVYIYGTGLNGDGDKIYRIQINSENKSEVFATLSGGDPALAETNSPNGIAVDKVRGLIFYSVDHDADTATPDKLYSIPLNTTLGGVATPTLRGTVIEDANAPAEQEVANGAAMYEGDYYYLKNRTNKWYKAILDDDGNVVDNVIACTAGDATGYGLGDITGLQGVLYGSVRDIGATDSGADTEFKFISLNLKTCTLTEYSQPGLPRQMQLAWGVDYLLYGYDPADKLLYLINKDTGARTAGPDYTTGAGSIGLVAMSDVDSLPPEARVMLTKLTNGDDNEQDWPDVPEITEGEAVTWTYEVENAGQLELTNVTVTDNKVASASIICDDDGDTLIEAGETDNIISTLPVDSRTTCEAEGTATVGQYENTGTVVAEYTSQLTGAGTVEDEDFDRYVGVVDEDTDAASFIIINHRAIRKDTQVNKDGGSIGPRTGTWTTADVGGKAKGKRGILPYFANNVGRTITILAGHVGFEAWFSPSCVPNKWLSPATRDQDNTCLAPGSADFTTAINNYFFFGQTPYTGAPQSVPASAGSSVDEKKLDNIPYVLPLRARGLKGLEGKKVCAVLYDANVPSLYNPVEPKITGDLKGFTYGIAAFEVLTATPRDKGHSAVTCAREKCLPEMTIKILDPAEICNDLELGDAPVPNHRVVPGDWYQVNPLYDTVGPNGYRALFYSDLF